MQEIRIHGRGGQGAVIASQILSYAFFLEGMYSQSFPTFGAERRGAPVAAFVRVDDSPINIRSQVVNPDFVLVLSAKLAENVDVSSGIKAGGFILINSDKSTEYYNFIEEECTIYTLNINKIALKYNLGNKIMPMVNAPILGAFAGLSRLLSPDSLIQSLPKFIPANLEGNIQALQEAYQVAGQE